ncbi:hypothetical protein CDD83_8579 [Cordyceps sp. RAO-2017]|nr:hypothetical protein CDD83_8579 [Cordyceps sp. RAO-2017]
MHRATQRTRPTALLTEGRGAVGVSRRDLCAAPPPLAANNRGRDGACTRAPTRVRRRRHRGRHGVVVDSVYPLPYLEPSTRSRPRHATAPCPSASTALRLVCLPGQWRRPALILASHPVSPASPTRAEKLAMARLLPAKPPATFPPSWGGRRQRDGCRGLVGHHGARRTSSGRAAASPAHLRMLS